MNDAVLTLNDVAIGYDRKVVLRGINLEVRRGRFYGLIGPNGSGKTTLLKTIAGIIPPVSGSIANERETAVGYVPQGESLDPIFLLSAYEVALMGTCGRVGPGRFPSKAEKLFVRECLERTGAAELQNRRFSELSGGQKQKVLIARALATRPDLLILDEPTTGLDPASTVELLELLKKLHAGDALTIIMVNHDLNFIRRSAQDIVWLHSGAVLTGSVEELLSREKIEAFMDFQLQ